MSEWKELEIDNLPPDRLTGDYEFMWNLRNMNPVHPDIYERIRLLIEIKDDEGVDVLLYRKPAPTPPTHEEIMTKWWDTGIGVWKKILSVSRYGDGPIYMFHTEGAKAGYLRKIDFTNMKSADMPPEGRGNEA